MKYEYKDEEYTDLEQLIEEVCDDMKLNMTDEEYVEEIDEWEDKITILGKEFSPGKALKELDYEYFLRNKNEDIWTMCQEIRDDVWQSRTVGTEYPIPYTDETIRIVE